MGVVEDFCDDQGARDRWLAAGFSDDDRIAWREAVPRRSRPAVFVRLWQQHDFAPEEAVMWARAGAAPAQASRIRDAGLTPEAVGLLDRDHDGRATATWGRRGDASQPFPLDEARRWIAISVRFGDDARRWIEAGFEPSQAESWVRLGICPTTALCWRANGLDAYDLFGWYGGRTHLAADNPRSAAAAAAAGMTLRTFRQKRITEVPEALLVGTVLPRWRAGWPLEEATAWHRPPEGRPGRTRVSLRATPSQRERAEQVGGLRRRAMSLPAPEVDDLDSHAMSSALATVVVASGEASPLLLAEVYRSSLVSH
ncbi:MAG: hypothetical protein M0014_04685 [Actinomycetota bacterium]|nr:hypothetical protein [Actinomycetota bacterium]